MPFGQQLYATGGNIRAAAYAGINTNRVRFIALVFCAVCATMAGLINIAYFRSFNPVAGQFRELDGIAAVIIGGGSIFGGYGTIIGSLAGAAVITLVRALLQLNVQGFTMPQHWVNVFIGVILIVAVLIDIWVRQANILGARARLPCADDDRAQREAATCLSRSLTTPIVEMRSINKAFGAVQALRDVDLDPLPGRDPRPRRRQFGRQVDADEDHDRRLPARYRRDPRRRQAGALQEPAREPRCRHRDDLPGLCALREHGRRPEHLPRPLAAARASSSTARRCTRRPTRC